MPRQVEAGEKVADICRKVGISEATYYAWKERYAGLGVSELRELRQLREKAEQLEPALEELIWQAAQGEMVYNDDTGMKVLVLDAPDSPERTGVFTSGIIPTREGQRMALFFRGRRHAGDFERSSFRNRLVHIIAMQNDFLERPIANVVVQGCCWLAQEQRQLPPMI